MVVDTASADVIAGISEPLWQEFRCKLDLMPVMVLDDLKKGLRSSEK